MFCCLLSCILKHWHRVFSKGFEAVNHTSALTFPELTPYLTISLHIQSFTWKEFTTHCQKNFQCVGVEKLSIKELSFLITFLKAVWKYWFLQTTYTLGSTVDSDKLRALGVTVLVKLESRELKLRQGNSLLQVVCSWVAVLLHFRWLFCRDV